MITPERGKLIPVSGNNNTPDMENAVDVQFNPISLKVTLSNTLKENRRNGNSRASQFVDKSSSTLAVELLFDTTYINSGPGEAQNDIEEGSDVRDQTKKIAQRFLQPVESGSQMEAPNRCLFQWGSFEFVGMVENYEETLDYFSQEGRPLRAKVVLRLKEDRYQFRQRTSGVADARRDTPTLQPTGNSSQTGGPNTNQGTSPVPGSSTGPNNWRETAMYNGVENPRFPESPVLALPSSSARTSAGGAAAASANSGVRVSSATHRGTSQPFSHGASTTLGTGVAGAFGGQATAPASAGASGEASGEAAVQAGGGIRSRVISASPANGAIQDSGVGFD